MQIIQKDLNCQIYFKTLGINAFNETLKSHLPNQQFRLNFTSIDLPKGSYYLYIYETHEMKGEFLVCYELIQY
jgi:hypothetical protein